MERISRDCTTSARLELLKARELTWALVRDVDGPVSIHAARGFWRWARVFACDVRGAGSGQTMSRGATGYPNPASTSYRLPAKRTIAKQAGVEHESPVHLVIELATSPLGVRGAAREEVRPWSSSQVHTSVLVCLAGPHIVGAYRPGRSSLGWPLLGICTSTDDHFCELRTRRTPQRGAL